MRIDVRECAEFQELRSPYLLSAVSFVDIEGSEVSYIYDAEDWLPFSFNISDGSVLASDRLWKEMNVLKKHFPEAFI